MSALICQSVQKKFGSFAAVKNVSFTVEPGECFGLLGPNGAGKSTLISMIYGAASRTAGSIQVFGLDPQVEGRRVRSQMGVVTQDNNLDSAMTVLENMQMYARYVGVPQQHQSSMIQELLEFMQLSHKADAVIESLSGGMQRRLVFVRALLCQPRILILDEPTTGLDPAVRQLLWDKVLEIKRRGTTILLTTHYMDEAERLCDRLVIMDGGEIKAQGSPRDLIAQNCPAYYAGVEKSVGMVLKSQLKTTLSYTEDQLHSFIGGANLQELTEELLKHKVTPQFIRPAHLEDVFLKITGRELAEND